MPALNRDRLSVHVVSNYVGKGFSLLSVYLFVPLFFAYLGPEAYGMVGFFAVLQGLLAFADLGLGATLSREMARLAARADGPEEIPDLLRTVELTCLVAGAALVAAIVAFSGLIGRHWLQAENLPAATLANTIKLMGLVIAVQLAAGVYQGGLMGLQHQVTSNVMQIVWGVIRGAGAVAALSPCVAHVVWLFRLATCGEFPVSRGGASGSLASRLEQGSRGAVRSVQPGRNWMRLGLTRRAWPASH